MGRYSAKSPGWCGRKDLQFGSEMFARARVGVRGSRSDSRPSSIEDGGLKWSKDVGVITFLTKFGEGLDASNSLGHRIPYRVPACLRGERMYTSAFTIGLGYLVGGLIPLLPYFFIKQASKVLIYSCVLTGTVLLIFGVVKARVTGAATAEGMHGVRSAH